MPRRPTPATDLITDTDPALTDLEVAGLTRMAEASPEEFQAALATVYRRLLVEGLRTVQAPRNLKEVKDLAGMLRQAEGLDKVDKGAGLPVGMVGVLRSVNRRAVVDAVESEPEFE